MPKILANCAQGMQQKYVLKMYTQNIKTNQTKKHNNKVFKNTSGRDSRCS
jgi:hypothetical protein